MADEVSAAVGAAVKVDWTAVAGISAAAVAAVTVTGAVVGFVTRPFKKLRNELKSVRDELSPRIDMVATEGRDAHKSIGERIQSTSDKLEDRIEKMNDRVDGVRQELGTRIDEVRRTVQDTAGDMREMKGTLPQIDKRLDELSRSSADS